MVNGYRSQPPVLNATILYEDFATGLRANILFERIVSHLNLPPESEVELLRLDLLRDASLLSAAAQTAANSELIILSAHGREHLPPDFEKWVNEWTTLKNAGPCAFVILLDGKADEPKIGSRILDQLQRTAGLTGVQVFHQFSDSDFPDDLWNAELADAEVSEVSRLPETDWTRGWGIND